MAADRVTEARVTSVYWPRKKTSIPDCSSFADVERWTYLLRELNLPLLEFQPFHPFYPFLLFFLPPLSLLILSWK